MPAIKNTYLKLLFSMFLLPAFFSCDKSREQISAASKNPNEITFISLSNIGGDQGDYKIIKVTKDSVHAEQGITARQTHKEWDSAISIQTWNNLISPINTKDLDVIQSSPSKQSVDGIDETFQIRTPKKSHIYVNSYADTLHYRQLKQFKEQLNLILPTEYR
ncbi:hypothetical protein N0B40_19775 [Chryseobacterium oranimense]|uniref:hypothetical protein n=1 Tax=Chryseobacterium oranimense TaxID=421058 RepID=UPI0021AEB25F|nr:hypothetical protein [Chryseobacterium oranimense]UWX60613.1 hypothetical protein N0B40_19775 [Chryseobacterium oranimense]